MDFCNAGVPGAGAAAGLQLLRVGVVETAKMAIAARSCAKNVGWITTEEALLWNENAGLHNEVRKAEARYEQAQKVIAALRQQVIDRDLLVEECEGLRKEIAAMDEELAALQAATSQAFPAPAIGPALGDQVAAFADAWASRGWPR